ncbi:hypothetical protein RCL1_002413 [Eukaryota sp. TZLM3-RCL]
MTSTVLVEVLLLESCRLSPQDIKHRVKKFLQTSLPLISPGNVDFSSDDVLSTSCKYIRIPDLDLSSEFRGLFFWWQVDFDVSTYHLHTDGGETESLEADNEETDTPALINWPLPSIHFEGLWEALMYDGQVKNNLLKYTETALLFSESNVNSNFVSWNRVVLLHGPPGSGKTSICKALAHKLSIRLQSRYSNSNLVEINAHSLFSRWFSESGKLVMRMFDTISDLLSDPQSFLIVLIDEVESLSASRKAAMSGSEPSDAIRVVNALLTQIDRIGRMPNVLILCTTNITTAVDLAFVDRADLKIFLGPPSVNVVQTLFKQSITSLVQSNLIESADENDWMSSLENVAQIASGLSGRTLRKLPFIAYAFHLTNSKQKTINQFIKALEKAVRQELNSRENMELG